MITSAEILARLSRIVADITDLEAQLKSSREATLWGAARCLSDAVHDLGFAKDAVNLLKKP